MHFCIRPLAGICLASYALSNVVLYGTGELSVNLLLLTARRSIGLSTFFHSVGDPDADRHVRRDSGRSYATPGAAGHKPRWRLASAGSHRVRRSTASRLAGKRGGHPQQAEHRSCGARAAGVRLRYRHDEGPRQDDARGPIGSDRRGSDAHDGDATARVDPHANAAVFGARGSSGRNDSASDGANCKEGARRCKRCTNGSCTGRRWHSRSR
jgi:hypothetical protein